MSKEPSGAQKMFWSKTAQMTQVNLEGLGYILKRNRGMPTQLLRRKCLLKCGLRLELDLLQYQQEPGCLSVVTGTRLRGGPR